ncbi:MAG: hypothetical protein U1E33_08925 [Rhodospirillales bacterium]
MSPSAIPTSNGSSTTLCRQPLGGRVAGDPGQQRAFRFIGNRVYSCQGVKVLGGRHVTILGNSTRAPLNHAVFLGDDPGYGEGARPIEDVLVSANTITDLVTAGQYGNDNIVDTAIIVRQFSAIPHTVVIRGKYPGAADGDQRADLVGVEAARHRRREPAVAADGLTGSLLWYDPVLTGEIFIGEGKAVRIEALERLDWLAYDVDDNRIEGFGDAFLRLQPAWAGDQLWTVPFSPGEFPVGAGARLTGLDLRGHRTCASSSPSDHRAGPRALSCCGPSRSTAVRRGRRPRRPSPSATPTRRSGVHGSRSCGAAADDRCAAGAVRAGR